jgi:4-amino-4-deoxy-L-arabinose transferase-like glycosyltransferase
VSRRYAYATIAAVCVLPRLVALVHDRAQILTAFVEKSDTMATVFLAHGTFGYMPGVPSASTQPLYGWFLITVYWIAGRNWWALGGAQIAVALTAALLVYEIGRRYLSPRAGLIAALVMTVQPYVIWHDVHANREILDEALGAAMFLLALLAGSRRSWPLAAALGAVTGVAVLSNSRLTLLPLVLGGYLLWRKAGWAAAVAVPLLAAVAVSPWVVRNKVQVGCFSLTTDARALWKANNSNTYATLKAGHWIDDVPDIPERQVSPIPDRWLTPQEAGDLYGNTGRKPDVGECAQQSHYQHLVFQFWEHHPGEKVKLAVQATTMMWDPRTDLRAGRSEQGGSLDVLRTWAQPLYAVPLFLLALAGLWFVAPAFRALALIFIGYETAMAWIFAGTTRYRVPWDFVLALLAAAALTRFPFAAVWAKLSRRPSSQKR